MKTLHISIIALTAVLFSLGDTINAFAVCCFPYDINYYIDPTTGNFVLNGELINDSYRMEPFGNASYRFAFFDKDGNAILEKDIILTDLLPIKDGVVIPLSATFPFQVVIDDVDINTIQESKHFRVDGTNTLDYFPWKPADLVVSSNEMTNVGTIHGKNGDVFNKWQIKGNITNTHFEKTENVYIVASLRDKNDGMLGVAGYSGDSIQPITLDGFETKDFVLYALVPASKTPSKVNLYAESDDSSMVFQYYKPITIRDAMNFDQKHTTDPKKPIIISANITNISRENLDFNWIIQIKKSPKSISEGDITEYPESRIAFIEAISGHVDAQESTILEYSWTPQSNGIYFYEMYVWDSSNAKALSYPFRQGFLTNNWLIVSANLNSVTNQIKSGIPLDEVQCSEGLELAHKASNGNLVCVKPETKSELIERGLIKLSSSDYQNMTLQDKLEAAQRLVTMSRDEIPFTMVGIDEKDKALRVEIYEGELTRLQNARDYYEKKLTEIIPFNIPIKIEFGKYWQSGDSKKTSPKYPTIKLVLKNFTKQDMQNPFYFYKIEDLNEIPYLNEIYKFGSVNVDETQYREFYDSFHKKCLERPDANMINCGSIDFAFEYNSEKYWIAEVDIDTKHSREITILSITPQNVTLPEPKTQTHKTKCNADGVCFTPE